MNRILSNLKDNWIKYGFETLAVTVGILGAFALENWKDRSLQEQELLEIYKTISEDLHSDIQGLDTLLIGFEWRIDAMLRIVTEPLSVDDWVNNDSLVRSFIGFPDFMESQRGLNLLKNKIAITGETGILASRITSFYDECLLTNNVTRNEFKSFFYDNTTYWLDHGEWFSKSFVDSDHSDLGHYEDLHSYKVKGAVLRDEINTFMEEGHYIPL